MRYLCNCRMTSMITNTRLFVPDTTAIISTFDNVFNAKSKISSKSMGLIRRAFMNDPTIKLSIPSIVFVEIYEKWYARWSLEEIEKFKSEIFYPATRNPNIEIKPIEKEVLENFIEIDDDIVNLENHDKVILASAMMLYCPLITNDPKVIKYAGRTGVIPKIYR